MNVFLAIRYVTFALLILFSGLTGSFAALNIGFITSGMISTKSPATEILDGYLVSLSFLTIIFVFIVIGVELCRKGALTSRIWFEFLWIVVTFLCYLGGAIAITVLIPREICQNSQPVRGTNANRHQGAMKMACMASTAVIVLTWITASLYLLYFIALLVYTLIRSRRESWVWGSSVIDAPKRSSGLIPVLITQTQTQSVDEPYQISFNNALLSANDTLVAEKERKGGNLAVRPPVFTRNPVTNGPPTFGNGPRSGADEVNHRPTGVDAINGAPAYQFQSHPYRTSDADLERSASPTAGYSQYPQRQAPWLDNEETPSPAVIKHASRVTPSVSLYPVHIVNTGLTTQPVKPNTPTAAGTLTGFLKVKGHVESKTSLPYLHSSPGTTERSIASTSVSRASSISHSQSHEGTVVTHEHRANASDTVSTRSSSTGRGRRSRPLHKPPPLNLLGLSNITNADRRR